jgi:cellulose biosynthesis protein BcsQ
MDKKCLYVAFSNQKGGVGKSAFTTLVASSLHYTGKRNVAVIDCDYPQHSIFAMRERDKTMVNSNDFYKEMIVSQFDAINKKAYPVVASKPEMPLQRRAIWRKQAMFRLTSYFLTFPARFTVPEYFNP